MPGKAPLRIFLSGDVMTGRGIDQILTYYANDEDCQWLLNALQKQSRPFNTDFKLEKNIIYLKR